MADPQFEIQMLHDRVLVRPVKESGEQLRASGIVIPATADQTRRLVWGEVCGVGTYVRAVKVGDKVLFHPADQFEVEIHGDTYLVMRERDLHATATERPEHGIGLYL